MNEILALPTGPLVDASLALVRATESRPIVNHSIRTFLFARLLAEHEGCLNDADYDEELLFAATVMHDLGLGEHARGQARFEVEGADLAAAVLREHGVAETDVERVWEAIALHSSHGLAERRGLLTYLTYKGVFIDAGDSQVSWPMDSARTCSMRTPSLLHAGTSRTRSSSMRTGPRRRRRPVRSRRIYFSKQTEGRD
jgi:HD domain